MARRRSHSVSFAPLIIVAVLAVGAYAAWQTAPRWWPATTKVDGTKPAQPVADVEIDVCRLVPGAAAAETLRWTETTARQVGAAADVPAAGSCTWRAGNRAVVANVFTTSSLGGDRRVDAHDYYESVVTGFEYALKTQPQAIAGLGDEAAKAGFEGGAGDAQIAVRKGDRVLHLVVRGATEADAVAFARRLAAAL